MLSMVQMYLVGILLVGSLNGQPNAQLEAKMNILQKEYITAMEMYSHQIEGVKSLGLSTEEVKNRIDHIENEMNKYKATYNKLAYKLQTEIKELHSIR